MDSSSSILPAGPRAKSQRDLAFTIAVALIALLPRVFVAIAWSREPVWDGHYYHFGATRIADGLGYSEDILVNGIPIWKAWCHYPVGYSAWLGGLYAVFGRSLLVAPIANALLGVVQVVVIHRLARYFLSSNRARIAAGLCALHPGLIAYSAVVMTEPLAALLISGSAWAMVAQRRSPTRHVLFGGLLLGLATLVRPSSLAAAPLSALLSGRKVLAAGLLAVLCSVVAVVVVSPWTYRNCQVMDDCAFVSTNGGWNLAIGALTETGRFRTLRAEDGCPVVTGQVQQDRCWAKVGREVILEDPKAWLALAPSKLSHTYDHESFAIEYLREADPTAWPEQRRASGRHLLTWFHRMLLIVAALSVVAIPRRKETAAIASQALLAVVVMVLCGFAASDPSHPFFWLPTLLPLLALLPLPGRPKQGPVGRFAFGLILTTSLTHAVFFGDDRYHLIVTPMFCLLAAAALRNSRERPALEAPDPSVTPQG